MRIGVLSGMGSGSIATTAAAPIWTRERSIGGSVVRVDEGPCNRPEQGIPENSRAGDTRTGHTSNRLMASGL
jgi:hypothetical protein